MRVLHPGRRRLVQHPAPVPDFTSDAEPDSQSLAGAHPCSDPAALSRAHPCSNSVAHAVADPPALALADAAAELRAHVAADAHPDTRAEPGAAHVAYPAPDSGAVDDSHWGSNPAPVAAANFTANPDTYGGTYDLPHAAADDLPGQRPFLLERLVREY